MGCGVLGLRVPGFKVLAAFKVLKGSGGGGKV